MKNYSVEEFNRFQGEIMVECESDQYAVNEADFEKYLQRNNCLEWEMNYSDHNGEHVQRTGNMSLDEYFAQPRGFIKIDLAAYLQSKHVTKDIFTILGEFFKPSKTAYPC